MIKKRDLMLLSKKIQQGDKVKVKCQHFFANGVFCDLEDGIFLIEAGQKEQVNCVFRSLSKKLLDMREQEKKNIYLSHKEAFGKYEKNRKIKFSRKLVFGDISLQDTVKTPSGNEGLVTEIEKDSITIDTNHPLAGKNISFDLQIISIET
jgi:FKBP-type peptidyl-prolyl cis-trans isomerase 2